MSEPAVGRSRTSAPVFLGLYRAEPHGEIARLLLAFLASAGLFYVNIMPALVDGLIHGAGFSNRDAGMIGSSNVYGAALGALTAVFLVKRINWRAAAYALLAGLICMDLVSMLLHSFQQLVVARFLHGYFGGMLVGIGFSIIARTREADRTFGYLLMVQVGLGGVGLMLLPPLVPMLGTWVLFAALILFSSATLAMVPFLDAYPAAVEQERTASTADGRLRRGPLTLSLVATFLFQGGNMAVYAYMIGVGRAAGLGTEITSPALAVADWIAIAGSGLVILLSTRYGRTLPLTAAILVTAACTWALHFSGLATVFVTANCVIGITWAFGIPYLLGMCAEFDATGQMAALGGFASKMGLASGPMLAALVVGKSNYALVIDLGTAILLLCLVAVLWPARLLDRDRRVAARALVD
jgi:predicted MFS family arabinose efflux permease